MKKLILTVSLAAGAVFAQMAAAADGEAVYKQACFACHDTGAAGAPKRGDAAAWAPRIEKGLDALVASAVNGLNAMPPKGTCMTCSDEDLKAAVEYLVTQAQAGASQTAAPPAPADTAESAPEATADTAAPATLGDAGAGAAKAAACIACHGPNGNSLNPEWPKLAGQHEDYLLKQLRAFKAGERQNELMTPMTAPLSEQDMRDIAAYFAAQAISEAQANAELLSAGERVYTGGNLESGVVACAGCHGPSGVGNPAAGFPRLAGQHAAYVAKALKDYRAGTRSSDLNGMMRGVANDLTDAEIAAVAEYVTNLR